LKEKRGWAQIAVQRRGGGLVEGVAKRTLLVSAAGRLGGEKEGHPPYKGCKSQNPKRIKKSKGPNDKKKLPANCKRGGVFKRDLWGRKKINEQFP